MIYKHNFEVGINDINKKFRMTNKAILECLENASSLHSISLGRGIDKIREEKLTWFLIEWDLEILKRPKYNDVIEVATWCKQSDKRYAYLDFEIYVNDKKYINATSKWMLFNIETKQVEEVTKDYINKYMPEDKEAISKKKLTTMEIEDNYDVTKDITIRKSDLDFNNHLHNLVYLDLIKELVNDNEEFNNLRIVYKKEIKYTDKVTISRKDNKDKISFLIKTNNEIVNSIIECKKSTL